MPPWVNSFTSSWIVKNVLPCIERLQSSRLLTRLFRLEPVQPEVPGAPPFECHPEDAMEAWAKDIPPRTRRAAPDVDECSAARGCGRAPLAATPTATVARRRRSRRTARDCRRCDVRAAGGTEGESDPVPEAPPLAPYLNTAAVQVRGAARRQHERRPRSARGAQGDHGDSLHGGARRDAHPRFNIMAAAPSRRHLCELDGALTDAKAAVEANRRMVPTSEPRWRRA